jgi:hypothetical protein
VGRTCRDVDRNFGEVDERLTDLERTDEERQREWLQDMPSRRQTVVTYRPRRDRAGEDDEPELTNAEMAQAVMDGRA